MDPTDNYNTLWKEEHPMTVTAYFQTVTLWSEIATHYQPEKNFCLSHLKTYAMFALMQFSLLASALQRYNWANLINVIESNSHGFAKERMSENREKIIKGKWLEVVQKINT